MLVSGNSQLLVVLIGFSVVALAGVPFSQSRWKAHDMNRPRPPVVSPPSQQLPVPVPPDGLVLFDGENLSHWESPEGTAPRWVVSEGAMISVTGSGYIQTREGFGDLQLHLEWAAPLPVEGDGQGRGNSGVYLMGLYEVQILDSYRNPTYADGQAGAIYGQSPPSHNVCLPPGEWQTFDIFFRRPRFSLAGALLEPARMTVLHNGVLIQNNVELWGPTMWLQSLPYEPHPDRLPLALQDHGNPVRFRNIWLRKVPESEAHSAVGETVKGIDLSREVLDRYVGEYQTDEGSFYTLRREGPVLEAHFYGGQFLELVVESHTRFSLKRTDGFLDFELDKDGVPTGFTFHIGGASRKLERVP